MQKSLDLSKVRAKLSSAGFVSISKAKGRESVLIIDGLRVEVKQSSLSSGKWWKVNLHRHGVLDESDVDAYLLLLNGVPGVAGGMSLYLIIPAPQNVKGLAISFSSLMRQWRDNIEAWKLLKDLIESRSTAA